MEGINRNYIFINDLIANCNANKNDKYNKIHNLITDISYNFFLKIIFKM